MFGPYEITHQGHLYHGNVHLAEYHLFARHDAHSLLLVQDMTAVPIVPALARAITRLIPGPGTLIPDSLMQALRSCGLVAGEAAVSDTADPTLNPADRSVRQPVVTLVLFLAQQCNLRCVYCYGAGGEYGERGLMSAETALAAVDWLMENSLDAEQVYISFFGGEPLLNFPLLQQVVSHARQQAVARGKQVAFSMTTNGTLLTGKIIAYLKAEQIEPLISFDGPPQVQNRQRPFRNGRGSYDRVYAKVQQLRASFPQLTAAATVYGEADPFAIRRGLDAAGFATCDLTPASPVMLHGPPPVQDDSQAARERAAARMLVYRRDEVARLFKAVRDRALATDVSAVVLILLAGLVTGRKRHVACGIGRGMASVAVSGDLYPCHRFVGQVGVRLGHLRDYRAGPLTDYHHAVVDRLPVCRLCWARYFCGGGCFYDNQARTGDMHRPDPLFCRETQTLCEDLIHGWCHLNVADQSYLRERVTALETVGTI